MRRSSRVLLVLSLFGSLLAAFPAVAATPKKGKYRVVVKTAEGKVLISRGSATVTKGKFKFDQTSGKGSYFLCGEDGPTEEAGARTGLPAGMGWIAVNRAGRFNKTGGQANGFTATVSGRFSSSTRGTATWDMRAEAAPGVTIDCPGLRVTLTKR